MRALSTMARAERRALAEKNKSNLAKQQRAKAGSQKEAWADMGSKYRKNTPPDEDFDEPGT